VARSWFAVWFADFSPANGLWKQNNFSSAATAGFDLGRTLNLCNTREPFPFQLKIFSLSLPEPCLNDDAPSSNRGS
jgi:hypothetical protein